MNEAETRAELIDPALASAGWGVIEDSRIRREYSITKGRIQPGGRRSNPLKADYVLVYRGKKLAAIEAKSDEKEVSEGVGQAKNYAIKLDLETTFAANGREIYQICMKTGTEGTVDCFPSPEQLWQKTYGEDNEWRQRFNAQPMDNNGGQWEPRYFKEAAVDRVLNAIADGEQRILLTMATGTGKTSVAFEISWKLFHTRWNLFRDGTRRPRILFLADRNILANQAFNAFSAFPDDALVRIRPDEIKKGGVVPTNGSIFFTIFQTFMSGPEKEDGTREAYFGQYPEDFFDFIIIDECHRGGANDESNWREIMEYFSPAVQLGLTATPKRRPFNADTYKYFGEPVYTYSLKDGINDGFLTPFKVKRIQMTIDEYIYTADDEVLEGDPEVGKLYTEADFNRIIEMKEREEARVKELLEQANQSEKAIVFCAKQSHAALVRDLINRNSESTNPLYCCRVTANDGALGEQHLKAFQDNEKTIPTVLTTSRKLSTGVDAPEVRNIALLRPVNNLIEFKQIIGRGTRLFDGKDYFTIYDFVDAYQNFLDPEWDGEPIEADPPQPRLPRNGGGEPPGEDPEPPQLRPETIKIRLSDGKVRQIQSMTSTSFWSPDGRPISAEEFLESLYGRLPEFYSSEEELREIWSRPETRKALLERLDDAGYGIEALNTLRDMIAARESDLFDVLEYVSFAAEPMTRAARVASAEAEILESLSDEQRDFVQFVLSRYVESGVEVLSTDVLPELLEIKYQAISDATLRLGSVEIIRNTFIEFQKYLYLQLAV